jgi:hypothetical protein
MGQQLQVPVQKRFEGQQIPEMMWSGYGAIPVARQGPGPGGSRQAAPGAVDDISTWQPGRYKKSGNIVMDPTMLSRMLEMQKQKQANIAGGLVGPNQAMNNPAMMGGAIGPYMRGQAVRR